MKQKHNSMKYLLTVFILLNSIQTRAASFYNGSELLEYCEHYLNKTDVGLANACYGYVAGHHDAENFFLLNLLIITAYQKI